MGGLRRQNSPTGVSPKNSKVDFAGVTGVSRPVNNEEHWTLYYFEAHAATCETCMYPLDVSKAGKQLCDEGHKLAIDVAELIFRRKDGEVYSRVKDGEQEVRVEIPHGYDQTLSLLKAIQRTLRKGSDFLEKPKSHDRSYYVGSRIPTDHKVKRESRDHQRKEDVKPIPRTRYETVIVQPSSPQRPRRRDHDQPSDSSKDLSKRGSLYGKDMGELEKAEKRERQLRYNLEVREPSALILKANRRYSTYHS
jgi:hypothetical protein